jgi:HemX protein
MERGMLLASTFCFLLGFAYTMYALGARHYRKSRFNFGAIFCGCLFQTAFLFQRGHALGRCPLTNLFEVFIFLSWSIVLLYLVVGTAYRLSLLGFFTSPLVFILQTVALLLPIDTPAVLKSAHPNPWLELHAAVSVIAYGAFALACVAGVMYLVQERQLKTHHIRSIFYQLPPIHDLAVAITRLLLAGFVLLTGGLLAGFLVGQPLVKIALGVGVWVVYGVILQAEWWKKISPHRVAIFSVVAFTFALSTLWGMNLIGDKSPL